MMRKKSSGPILGERKSQEKGTAVSKGPEGSRTIGGTWKMPVGNSEDHGVSTGRHTWRYEDHCRHLTTFG